MQNFIAVALGLAGLALSLPDGAAASTPLDKNSWALLVAGSSGWTNYRHQADICHAYHIMIAEGISPERIVVMMYDDIANNEQNPNPGVIINRPHGPNVYPGVKIDYKGRDVTPENFLRVLSGDKEAMNGTGTGRVIESNHETNIFVYFADHGGAYLLGFPDQQVLSAHDLHKCLLSMHEKNQYKKIIMYIEACLSGSMFDNILEENTGVFAMTAAGRDEDSWGYYCHVPGLPCLGDLFSISWMENMDSEKKGTLEQLSHQYDVVRTRTVLSHVQVYGDWAIGLDDLTPNKNRSSSFIANGVNVTGIERIDGVDSRDVPLHWLKMKVSHAEDDDSRRKALEELDELIRKRKLADKLFEDLVAVAAAGNHELIEILNYDHLPVNERLFPCYTELIGHFKSHCFGGEHEYFFKHFGKLANICLAGVDTTTLIKEMGSICARPKASIKSPVV